MLQTTNPESVTPQGIAVLNDSALNKGTAFTTLERKRYGIEGLLPHSAETIERQVLRVLGHLSAKATDLERYIYLIGLEERNETLFYRTVMSDPARFLPILYILACARGGGPRLNWTNWWRSLFKPFRTCFRAAASTSRIGMERTPSESSTGIKTRSSATMMTSRVPRA